MYNSMICYDGPCSHAIVGAKDSPPKDAAASAPAVAEGAAGEDSALRRFVSRNVDRQFPVAVPATLYNDH